MRPATLPLATSGQDSTAPDAADSSSVIVAIAAYLEAAGRVASSLFARGEIELAQEFLATAARLASSGTPPSRPAEHGWTRRVSSREHD